MLKKFSVKGFKSFANRITLDFSDVRDYQFQPACIRNGLLNKLIIYGRNGSGKSNLGLALFDITTHLTENNVSPKLYDFYYNADSIQGAAYFEYVFQFGSHEIRYKYAKYDVDILAFEELFLDNELLFDYDFQSSKGVFDGIRAFTPNLNFEFKDSKLSVLRYIVNNSSMENDNPLKQLMNFVSRMLWFRSLDENRYIGYRNDSGDYYEFIFRDNHLQEFQDFLHQAGINEALTAITTPSGEKALYFKKMKKRLPFFKTASNGTKALYTFFYWIKTSKDLSFLFIDEFDAYYHVELSEMLVKMLEEQHDFQTILTSHNTNLLSSRIMRPDCYFILAPERLVSLANATSRELREGHNLEKLYLNGEFDA